VFLKIGGGANRWKHQSVINARLIIGRGVFLGPASFDEWPERARQLSVATRLSPWNVWTLIWSKMFFNEPSPAEALRMAADASGVCSVGMGN